MTLEFMIDGQRIKRLDSKRVVGDSIGYLKAHFTFSNDWKDVEKTVIFSRDISVHRVSLDSDDKCDIPSEVLKSRGILGISVVGTSEGIRITTDTYKLDVGASGFIPSVDSSGTSTGVSDSDILSDSDVQDVINDILGDSIISNSVSDEDILSDDDVQSVIDEILGG